MTKTFLKICFKKFYWNIKYDIKYILIKVCFGDFYEICENVYFRYGIGSDSRDYIKSGGKDSIY